MNSANEANNSAAATKQGPSLSRNSQMTGLEAMPWTDRRRVKGEYPLLPKSRPAGAHAWHRVPL